MSSLKSTTELKSIARTQLIGNYTTTSLGIVLFYFISLFINNFVFSIANPTSYSGLVLYTIIQFIVSIFLCVFAIGFAHTYLKLSCKQHVQISDIFYGFKENLNRNLSISLRLILIILFPYFIGDLICNILTHSDNPFICFAGYLILACSIIYAVIMFLKYGLVFFIALDFPQYDISKMFLMSSYLMKGNRFRLFYLFMGFIPLMLLSIFSLYVGLIWIVPYILASFTNFYLNLTNAKSEI